MKRRLLLFSLYISVVLTSGQNTYFNKRYNNDFASGAKSIINTENGYVISGVSGVISNDYIFKRIVMTSIDAQGNQIWWKTYGEDFHNYYAGDPRSTDGTYDGGFIIGGCIEDSIRNVGLLIKFDQFGDSLWSRIYGDTTSPIYSGIIFRKCQELPDHNIILIGSTFVSQDDIDIIAIKTDSLGNIIWQQTYGDLNIWEDAYSIAQLSDGGFIIGFAKVDINWLNSHDPGILKIDSLGNQIWMNYYGSSMDEWGCSVSVSQDGNYLFGTTYAYEEPGPEDPLQKVRIIKTDTSGIIIWDKKYGYPYFLGSACTIDELSDGNIIVSGQGGFQDSYNMEGWIIKVKPNGDSIWMRRYAYYNENGGYLNYLMDITITNDNGIILTGEVLGAPEWEQSIWVQKLDSIGCDFILCDTTVGIQQYYAPINTISNILVYPNPASYWIHILFRESKPNWASDRRLIITNIFGEQVIKKDISRLSQLYECNVATLPCGIYLITIFERQKSIYTNKIVISR